jgi:hypothetical protein
MFILFLIPVTGIVINFNNCHQDLTFGTLYNRGSCISNNQVSGFIGWSIQFCGAQCSLSNYQIGTILVGRPKPLKAYILGT